MSSHNRTIHAIIYNTLKISLLTGKNPLFLILTIHFIKHSHLWKPLNDTLRYKPCQNAPNTLRMIRRTTKIAHAFIMTIPSRIWHIALIVSEVIDRG